MIRLQKGLMAAFLFLTPLLYPLNGTMDLRTFQQVVFQYGAMILCTFFVRNIWMSLFFTWTVFLFWLNGASVGSESVLNIFLGIMLFGISRNYFLKHKFEDSARWIVWVGIVSMIFMVAQLFGIDPLHSFFDPTKGGVIQGQDFHDPVGMFMMKAHTGIFMAVMGMVLVAVHPVLGILSLVPVWYSDSTAVMMATVGGLLFYFFYLHKRVFYAFVAIGIVGATLYGIRDFHHAPEMYRSRWGMWHLTIKKTLERPIGYGPDSFRSLTPNKNFLIMSDNDMTPAIAYSIPGKSDAYRFMFYDPSPARMKAVNERVEKVKGTNLWDHPHNEYLNILFCFGFPGAILVFMFLKDIWKRFSDAPKTKEVVCLASIIVVYLLSSTTQFPFSVARLAYLFPVILGAFYATSDT